MPNVHVSDRRVVAPAASSDNDPRPSQDWQLHCVGTRSRTSRTSFYGLVWVVAGVVLVQATLYAVPEIGPRLFAYMAQRYGAEAANRTRLWEGIIRESANLPDRQKLTRVNRFFNQLRFVSDEIHWGRRDYWASPLEMLGTNGGDCEDFSIAKYFTLRDMGVPDRKLQITYVRAVTRREAHMVLAYYETPDADPLILDNLVDEIRLGSERRDLVPVYGFNGDGLWRAKERGQGRRVGAVNQLKLWHRLATKMLVEDDEIRALSGLLRPVDAWESSLPESAAAN